MLLSCAILVSLQFLAEATCSTRRTSLFCHGDVVLSQVPHHPLLRLMSFAGATGCFTARDLLSRQPGLQVIEAVSSDTLCVCLAADLPCGVSLEDCPGGSRKGECPPPAESPLRQQKVDLGAVLGSIAVVVGGLCSATGFGCFCYLKRENRAIRTESQRILSETRSSELTTPIHPFPPQASSTPFEEAGQNVQPRRLLPELHSGPLTGTETEGNELGEIVTETGAGADPGAGVEPSRALAQVHSRHAGTEPLPPVGGTEGAAGNEHETPKKKTPKQRRQEVDFLNPGKEPMKKSTLRSGKDF